LSEDGLEVVRIDCGVASIPPFRIDVPSSSENIRFCAETTRTEPDDKIELGEILGPPRLPLGQYLGSRKILKVLMIRNNVDGIGQTFQIVLPNLESFENGKQFLVMCVVVQLHRSKSARVKGNWVNFKRFFLEIWLRPRKSTQRHSEPSFFLTNKTGAPCGDEVGQIKPMLRFSSMNSFRASCSDAEREYMGPTGG